MNSPVTNELLGALKEALIVSQLSAHPCLWGPAEIMRIIYWPARAKAAIAAAEGQREVGGSD